DWPAPSGAKSILPVNPNPLTKALVFSSTHSGAYARNSPEREAIHPVPKFAMNAVDRFSGRAAVGYADKREEMVPCQKHPPDSIRRFMRPGAMTSPACPIGSIATPP